MVRHHPAKFGGYRDCGNGRRYIVFSGLKAKLNMLAYFRHRCDM